MHLHLSNRSIESEDSREAMYVGLESEKEEEQGLSGTIKFQMKSGICSYDVRTLTWKLEKVEIFEGFRPLLLSSRERLTIFSCLFKRNSNIFHCAAIIEVNLQLIRTNIEAFCTQV